MYFSTLLTKLSTLSYPSKVSKVFIALGIVATCLVPSLASADVVYTQMTSSTGIIERTANTNVLIGSFTASSDVVLSTDSIVFLSGKSLSGSCSGSVFEVYFASSTSPTVVIGGTSAFDLSESSYSPVEVGFTNPVYLISGGSYVVGLASSCNPGTAEILSNVAEDSFYGYISSTGSLGLTTHIISMTPENDETVASTMSILLIYEFVKLIIFNIWGIVNLLVLV